jgi:hypothetical protein
VFLGLKSPPWCEGLFLARRINAEDDQQSEIQTDQTKHTRKQRAHSSIKSPLFLSIASALFRSSLRKIPLKNLLIAQSIN